MNFQIKKFFRNCVVNTKEIIEANHIHKIQLATDAILSSNSLTDVSEAEEKFEWLQNFFPVFNEENYAYDPFSLWDRGEERASTVLILSERKEPGLRIFEAGCGDGMAGFLLSCYGHDVVLSDMEDWRDKRSLSIPFFLGEMESGLSVESNQFDVVFSYNTFEHVINPYLALQELIRVCKKQWLIYLDFGPLYASPWGLHAYRMLRMPYSQFLFTEEFIDRKLKEIGVSDLGRALSKLQPLNRWRVSQFDTLWADSGCQIVQIEKKTNFNFCWIVNRYPRCFTGRGLTFPDITTYNIRVVLRKV